MNNNENDPDSLYRNYKASRLTSAPGIKPPTDTQHSDEEALVDQVYRQYQQTRSSAESEIDKIMQMISSAPESASDEQSQINETTLPAAADQQVNTVGQQPNSIAAPEQSGTEAANDHAYILKYVVPAIAATLFAFFVFPLFNSHNKNIDATLDPAMITAELSTYIEPANSGMLGFSDTDNENSTAIRYGILATDLQVLSNTQDSADTIGKVVKSYLLSERPNAGSVVAAAQIVVSGMTTGNNSPDEQAVLSIASLINELAEHTAGSNTFEWYKVGQATESVILAAQLALSSSDTALLHSALLHGNSLAIPNTNPLLQAQIKSLFSENVDISMAPADIRRILNKARDIKSVAQ